MNGRFLLDTNIVIALFARDALVHRRLQQASHVFLPCVALGELYYGAYYSTRVAANSRRIDELATRSAVLNCDSGTARQYGRIKNRLRSRGRPLPENDIWIAAIAQQHQLTLVSRDQHFKDLEHLSWEVW